MEEHDLALATTHEPVEDGAEAPPGPMIYNGAWRVKAPSQSRHPLGQKEIFAPKPRFLRKAAGADHGVSPVRAIAGGKIAGGDDLSFRRMKVSQSAPWKSQNVFRISN